MNDVALTKLAPATLAARLRAGAVGARETAEAFLAAIAVLDRHYRAYITVAPDILDAAAAADAMPREVRASRPLHGVPVAIKDVIATAGLRTTFGSRRYADHVPAADDPLVTALKAAGAIVLGKTNTPEFGFGAVCDNPLCGPTCNPWDAERTSGGSSGGSAVAVTTGLAPLAIGTDFGGSVRTPASFCGCVGLRPTPGTLESGAISRDEILLSTPGVLARTVADAAFLAGIVGSRELRMAASAPPPDISTLRLATSVDLGGAAPVDPDVRRHFAAAVERAARVFRHVRQGAPDCGDAARTFHVLRVSRVWQTYAPFLESGVDDLTPSFVWNVRQGEGMAASDVAAAEARRAALVRRFLAFFETADLLMLPAVCVMPFPNAQREVLTIDGRPTVSIIDYLRHTSVISLVGFPALSVPTGLTPSGLPFGVQLVAPPHREAVLFAAARALEEAAGFRHLWPPVPHREEAA